MMAQAARDPLFWPALTVAAQDSIYAFGRPNAADGCVRCHLPAGWLEQRSDPVNAAKMNGADFDGVGCDACHRMIDPFFADTAAGTREGSDWVGYWDETGASATPSQAAAAATLAADITQTSPLDHFNGAPLRRDSPHRGPGVHRERERAILRLHRGHAARALRRRHPAAQQALQPLHQEQVLLLDVP